MIFLIALIPATMLTIAGYFVLYLSNRSEGAFKAFGKYLGFWAITLAGLVILGALFAAAHGGRYGGPMGLREMHLRMHSPWPGDPRLFRPGPEEPREPASGADRPAPDSAPPPPLAPASPPR